MMRLGWGNYFGNKIKRYRTLFVPYIYIDKSNFFELQSINYYVISK